MQFEISNKRVDPEWDAFVGRHPYGHHEQTAAFAHIRAASGFECVRVLAREPEGITAGAQIIYRRMPLVGALALCSQGPVVDPGDASRTEGLFGAIDALCRRKRFMRLRVISYAAQEGYAPALGALGFRRAGYRWASDQTALVDVREPDEAIQAKMHRKGRYNIRVAIRKGVEVRAGDAQDLSTFHRLMAATAERQGFPVLPLEYFEHLWSCFAPADKLRLLIASYEDTPLATVLLTRHGDRVSYGWGGRSDEHRNRMPNYLLHWTGIQWAREQGCSSYDFAGVSDDSGDGVSTFKRRLGAITDFPDPQDRYYGSLGHVYRAVCEAAWDKPRLRRAVENLEHRLYGALAF